MGKNKRKRDILSEQQFNQRTDPAVLSPNDDSPGDSDETRVQEFMLGLNFMPDEKNEYEDTNENIKDIIYADDNSHAPSETPSEANFRMDETGNRLPETAKVIDSSSETH